jgi:hypothetical protein
MAWHRRSGLPAPVPADPLHLALDGSLMVCLDRQLAMAALRALEAERRRLIAERRRVAAARAQLLAGPSRSSTARQTAMASSASASASSSWLASR